LDVVDRLVDQVIQSDLDQVIFIGPSGALARTLARFNEAGRDAAILSSDGAFSVNQVNQILEDSGNCRLFESSFYNPLSDTPEADRFRKSFREKYGIEPETNDALYYDAVKLIAHGVTHAGADREALRNYLAGMGDKTPPYEGVSGKIAFSGPEGNRRIVTIFSYNDGFSVFETAIVPSEDERR
jgi:ABC-type branched-subunit amino acid transport system substrate-binding protein